MPDSTLLDMASLVAFTLGALAFSALVVMYVRQKQTREAQGSTVFAAFTAACAVAFVANIAAQIAPGRAAVLILGIVTALLPPLLGHLVYAKEAVHLSRRGIWIGLLRGIYAVGIAAAIFDGMNGLGLGEWTNSVPSLSLAISAMFALMAQLFSGRTLDRAALTQRRWNQALLVVMVGAAISNVVLQHPLLSLLPDYLLLAFFCVTLYYEERLMFFDLLIKRGTFFTAALIALTAVLALAFRITAGMDWIRPWICALLLAPLWLAGPWMYRVIEETIDRKWLRRRYSLVEAAQSFVQDIQLASTESDLRQRVSASLTEIFQAPASVSFEPIESPQSPPGALIAPVGLSGSIRIDRRRDGMPLLSDDLRLLQSLGRTLAVVLENVRFREREQHLRSLATRAELKALRAQMNPHFLFNALNAIAGLIEEQPRLADETTEHLASVLRYTLRHSEHEWVRLDEEMEFVAAYLRVEQARFGDRLRVEIGVDDAAAGFVVPAMTIQPLVENAIKHGVSAVEGLGIVSVKVALDHELLRVAISDNGPGFPADFSIGAASHGLRNVAERIAGYYGGCATLRWNCAVPGANISMTLPTRSENNGRAHSHRG